MSETALTDAKEIGSHVAASLMGGCAGQVFGCSMALLLQ